MDNRTSDIADPMRISPEAMSDETWLEYLNSLGLAGLGYVRTFARPTATQTHRRPMKASSGGYGAPKLVAGSAALWQGACHAFRRSRRANLRKHASVPATNSSGCGHRIGGGKWSMPR